MADDSLQPGAAAPRVAAVIPAFREEFHIGAVVRGVRRHVETVLVVDDGSPDRTAEEAERAGAVVVRHDANRGKAAALRTAYAWVRERGFSVVVTLDGDGQHDPDDLPRFLGRYARGDCGALVGNRMRDCAEMPTIRRWTNRFTSWLLSREMRQSVPDTQCGYRLYRTDLLPLLASEAERFAAESEGLLRLADRGVRIGEVPIRAVYRDEKSKINPVLDAVRFFAVVRRHRRRVRTGSAGGPPAGRGGAP